MPESPSPPKALQFSLRTAMIVTATVAIVLALSRWNPLFGGPASVLIAGGTWTALAVRARHRRLAYYLAGATMGVIALAVVFLPLLPVMVPSYRYDAKDNWASMALLAVFSAATTTCVAVLRRRICERTTSGHFGAGLLAVYLTAALFCVYFAILSPAVAPALDIPAGDIGGVAVFGIAGALGSPIVATFYLPLAWPVAIGCVAVLRRIDPDRGGSTELERRVVEAVRTLQAAEVSPIRDRHLANMAPGDPAKVALALDHLVVRGVLTWSPEDGYRVAAG